MGDGATISWDKVDQPISALDTNANHPLQVQREAVPLVFVPGIMGSRLRRAGTSGTGDGPDGLPNLRWDPGSAGFMFWQFSGASATFRKRMLIGEQFDPQFLEPDNADPIADGFKGIMDDYWKKYLNKLKEQQHWGRLTKIFEFPVYAVGYNWTDSNENSGAKLADRIQQIIAEAASVTGLCKKVILITHSMGGLVARWASEIASAQSNILGVVHGVQPVTGAAAAYWRIKAGFEGFGMTSRVLGHSAREVTPLLGGAPGGLQLLPNKLYKTNSGSSSWLTITQNGKAVPGFPLPRQGNPYQEIYGVKAAVRAISGSGANQYWGLVDPDLLDPGATKSSVVPAANPTPADQNDPNALDADTPIAKDAWDQYLNLLTIAEDFHDALGSSAHPLTFSFHGTGYSTADSVELRVESAWFQRDPYPVRGFRGYFHDQNGSLMQAVLQDPAGAGDGTVPVSSASFLDSTGKPIPGDTSFKAEHQPAFESSAALDYTVKAIIALCKMKYDMQRSPQGDFPSPSTATRYA